MTQHNSTFFYHLVAFITVAIWGTTFVSTKVLMLHGLSPAQIFTLRFFMAYVLMLCFNHRRLFASSWRDEGRMMLLGITGGSLYFLSENEAMNFTTATNTSLIVCSCPLFATLLVRLVYRSSHIHVVQLMGSLLAFVGMVIVVLNGRFVLHLSPVGDALAFTACMCWAVYSLLMKSMSDKYSAAFITRKVFFYGVLTILPYYAVVPGLPSPQVLTHPVVLANLLFLWTFAVVFCHNTLGYCLGWLAGKLAGFNTAKKRTISIEVGMQNAGLATVLAGNFFAAQPLAVLPCAISCAWHSISGTILAGIYLKWDKMHGKN